MKRYLSIRHSVLGRVGEKLAPEPIRVCVEVFDRGLKVLMSKLLLNRVDASARVDEISRKRVPEKMWVDPLRNASANGYSPEKFSYVLLLQRQFVPFGKKRYRAIPC